MNETLNADLHTHRFAQIPPIVYNRGLPMDLAAIQSALRERNIDAWLFYDHHHRDPIAYRVLGLPAGLMVTRRWFYLVPAQGEPVKLVHKIEAGSLPRYRHAVFAQQHRLHHFPGRCRDRRVAAWFGKERRQLRRPGRTV